MLNKLNVQIKHDCGAWECDCHQKGWLENQPTSNNQTYKGVSITCK